MKTEVKEMMEKYIEGMKFVTPDQDDYLAKHHLALEYSRLLAEEEEREKEAEEEKKKIEEEKRFQEFLDEVHKKQKTNDYLKQERKSSSDIGSVLLGIGAIAAGIAGCYAIAKCSSNDGSYTSIEDNSYDYTDYNCNNYYDNIDSGCDWY